ncbi:hypothetical protein PENARI_c015G04269 [Penicillium arizonense]|jgi:hypothetical protein|uniref:DNA2/NAM7 helicase-like C-terminal domain-containing protein n=1 Tax=Penicillium arizonense TaxID=1835702 RepID=A0A1F5LCB0_PENAI|nr:hypothetical protein PENARI_c015G04269 [Penicillium arizonense]OGE50842.1 hypothetical protein PENARI_c015G04269 [Penicillium arizonense]
MSEEVSPPGNDLRGKGKDKHLPQIDPDKNPALHARLNFNGAERYRLYVQQRLAGKIHIIVNRLFYNKIRWECANILDPSNYAGQFSDYNMALYQIKSNVIFLNVANGEESMQGYSFVNHRHISLALGLAHDLHTSLSVALKSIVILTGYEAQRRAYIVEQGRRQGAHPEVKWMDMPALVIGTFQGNAANVVIFDVVRTKEVGFMRSYRRLNVALSRGRFALDCLYNAGSMTTKEFRFPRKTIKHALARILSFRPSGHA